MASTVCCCVNANSPLASQNEAMKATLKLYDEALECYIPVLMGMARIYWDRENYPQVGGHLLGQGAWGRDDATPLSIPPFA